MGAFIKILRDYICRTERGQGPLLTRKSCGDYSQKLRKAAKSCVSDKKRQS